MGLTDFRPLLQVSLNGIPLGGFLFSNISSVRVTDAAGFESDTCEITFSNTSAFGRIAMPEPGALIEIGLGYLGKFKAMGLYVADEIEESSPPRQIIVTGRAKAQGLASGGLAPIAQQKTRSWEAGLTVKDIVSTIAGENGLDPAVTDAAASIILTHIDQIDESDLSVLTRIALAHDLVIKPAGGKLFAGLKGAGETASGGAVPTVTLLESSVTRWAMRRSLGEGVGTVIATYRDLEAASDIEVKAGSGEPERRLQSRFRTQTEAQAAADAELKRSARTKETLQLELPGNPNLAAEGRVVLVGASGASGGPWIITQATHSLSSGGYRTSVRAERPA